jgi:hypothetical protein
MARIAGCYAAWGVVLRSGGSPGADAAFEAGCGAGPREIYLPWAGFNDNRSPLALTDAQVARIQGHAAWAALRVALSREAPATDLDALPEELLRLYARDVCQVLGGDLASPSERVICWLPPPGELEGTRIAVYVARFAGVPVHDLARQVTYGRWRHVVASG